MTQQADYSVSFLDLLCAAMGGVALIVILFAAMRKNTEIQAEGSSEAMVLYIETGEGNPDIFHVGQHISFCITSEDGYYAFLGEEGEHFTIEPQEFRPGQTRFRFQLQGDIPDSATITVWLQHFDANEQWRFLGKKKPIRFFLYRGNELLADGELKKDFYSPARPFEVK
jgi:hypothetical protein